jgi:hypothetical protein
MVFRLLSDTALPCTLSFQRRVEFELVNVQEIAHARAILEPEQRFRFVSPLLDIACKIMHFRQAEAVRLIW